jgi:LysR family transcriptional regulator, hydrogen peroxide-inducible genes activator
MNLDQLRYAIAVDTHRHFGRAAEQCFVTQPTLSMMIKKLEEELGVVIFNRSRQPVVPTREGREVLVRARLIMGEVAKLQGYTSELHEDTSGVLRLAIIPTLAPYLLPRFLKTFIDSFPMLRLFVKEMITDEIIGGLHKGEIDLGLLATPLGDQRLEEHRLFQEEFLAYASPGTLHSRKRYILPSDIDLNRLWLLEEGHCLRNQVLNLCELKKQEKGNLQYEAGSIETLIRLVDNNNGITVIPRLAELSLSPSQKRRIREFAEPKPVREISLVAEKAYPMTRLLNDLKSAIIRAVPFAAGRNATRVVPI